MSLRLCRVGRSAAVHVDQDGLEARRDYPSSSLRAQCPDHPPLLPQRTDLLPPGNGSQCDHINRFYITGMYVGSSPYTLLDSKIQVQRILLSHTYFASHTYIITTTMSLLNTCGLRKLLRAQLRLIFTT